MIPPKQISILNAIGHYKFLSRLQMARLGIEKYNSAFSKHCKPLIEAKFIGVIDATNYGLGHIYYLKKKGALFILKEKELELGNIKYCKTKPELSIQTLFHRTHSIDIQIELKLSCKFHDIEILFYDRDIERLGNIKRDNNLIRKTRLNLENNLILEPDSIFMLQTSKGKKLYCLEYEHKDFTKKSYQKIIKHLQALNERAVSKKYDHSKAHRVLFVYHNISTLESIMKKVRLEIEGIDNWFLFKSFEEVKYDGGFQKSIFKITQSQDYLGSWRNANGDLVSLF